MDSTPPPESDPTQPETIATGAGPAGERVGPYRLVCRLGAGGMGEVWEALQERPVHRRVAVKLIKRGMDSKQVVARFESERQALALMDHPNIARVLEAGEAEDGRPYFVMEYVPGVPITDYCDRHHLPIRKRVELFMLVCEGVQHAHQKAVIHRDLKPSNVLVFEQDERATAKIIDFGIAKALTIPLTEHMLQTGVGQVIGTLAYMSPEQAASEHDVDTRADVYSLGVILYELLTGVLPHDRERRHDCESTALRRAIQEEDPLRPSTRLRPETEHSARYARRRSATSRALAVGLRGDLDWITLKALEKDRMRRYGSPADLAADLRRYLVDLPVEAGPPSFGYRARKFVRRHRIGVTVAAAAVGTLAIVAGLLGIQAEHVARERDRANREAETAREVTAFLEDLFHVVEPGQ